MRMREMINNQEVLTVKQILLFRTLWNVWRTVWRICILMLGCRCFASWFPTLISCSPNLPSVYIRLCKHGNHFTFFYKITNERGTKTVFTYAHVKWFYGQSERTYYLNYFIKPNESTNHHIHICTQMHQPLVTNIVHIMTMTKTYISFINWA